VTARDGLPDPQALDAPALAALVGRYEDAGWCVLGAREATSEDVQAAGSSWAKRLGIPTRRQAACIRLAPMGQANSSRA
jgi:hypothetical protein